MRRKGEDDFGAWQYGGPLAIPRELHFHDDGAVTTHPLYEIVRDTRTLPDKSDALLDRAISVTGQWTLSPRGHAQSLAPTGGVLLLQGGAADCYIEAILSFGAPRMEAHLLIGVDEQLCGGCKLSLQPATGTVSVRAMSEVDVDPVIESCPVSLDTSRPVRVRLFLQGNVLEAFVDDHASLTARLHRHRTDKLAWEFWDGPGSITDLHVMGLRSGSVAG